MKIEYIGKFVLIEKDKEKTLVMGDLHLGYEATLRESGILVAEHLFVEMEKDIEGVLKQTGKVDKIVILGDVKHNFGGISYYERDQFNKLLSLLKERTDKIVITKGNHDKLLNYMGIKEDKKIEIVDFYNDGEILFVHGDKDYEEIWDKKIKLVFMGHVHPAVTLVDGVKREKYKCFLEGEYKRKKFVILPSLTGKNEGTDPRDYELDLPWKLNLDKFEVVVIGENLKTYNFGKLKEI